MKFENPKTQQIKISKYLFLFFSTKKQTNHFYSFSWVIKLNIALLLKFPHANSEVKYWNIK